MSTAQKRKYKSVLVWMMLYLDEVLYGIETDFYNERLNKLMPEDIMMIFLTFGVENPKDKRRSNDRS